MSPNCCVSSEERRTVRLFVPANQTTPAHWVVPLRGDDGSVSDVMSTPAYFCPFCGIPLGRQHLPFERSSEPSSHATPKGNE